MSVVVSISEYFYLVCSRLADGVETTKGAVQYITQTNYNVVTGVISFICFVFEIVGIVLEQGFLCLQGFLSCVTYLLKTIWEFVDSIFCFLCLAMSRVCSGVLDLYNHISSYIFFIFESFCNTAFSVKNTVVNVHGLIASVFSWVLTSCASCIVSMYMFFAGIGQWCVSVVTSTWQCLGFILSSIAYFPVYCFGCVESFKNQVIHSIVDAFTAMPKESYLIMICLCLLYFTVSNAIRYVSSHGIRKLFSSRLRSSRLRPTGGVDWQFVDADFESDFEDLYGDDANHRNVWMIPGSVRGRRTDGREDEDASDNESDGSDSDTIDDDDESSDNNDGGSEDGFTVISDDSDSDNSINSQTLSTESSEQEIEVSLPDMDDRYSLRSRSSTPSSCFPKIFSSPEEFEREMEKEKDKRKCVVCQDQVKSVLVMPCRHMCMCVMCADQIVKSRNAGRRVCPLCRTKIQKVMSVYV